MAHLEEPAEALRLLERSVGKGFCVPETLAREPLFDPLRGEPAFFELIRRAETGRDAGRQAVREAGGEALLGIRV